MRDLPIAEYFKYHPPITKERRELCREMFSVNESEYELALAERIAASRYSDTKRDILFAIDQKRIAIEETERETRWIGLLPIEQAILRCLVPKRKSIKDVCEQIFCVPMEVSTQVENLVNLEILEETADKFLTIKDEEFAVFVVKKTRQGFGFLF